MRHVLIHGTCLVLLLLAVSAQADIQAGLAWLTMQAQPDGRLATASDLATPVQATSEALRTLHALGETAHSAVAPARQFLAEEPFANTEYRVR